MEDKDFSPGALLRPEPGIDTPFADFYRMLWFSDA